MTVKEYKKLKAEILDDFLLSELSIKNMHLTHYELEMIYKNFSKYSKEDIDKALEMYLNGNEKQTLSREVELDRIKNKVFKDKKVLDGSNFLFFAKKLGDIQKATRYLKTTLHWFTENKIKVDQESINKAIKESRKNRNEIW